MRRALKKSFVLFGLLVLVLPLALSCAAQTKEVAPAVATATTAPAAPTTVATPSPKETAKPAPTTAAAEEQPTYGGVIRTVIVSDPPHWDPHKEPTSKGHQAVSVTNLRLLNYPMGSKYEPGDCAVIPSLAESWEIPNDTTYIFHLYKGIKWENKPPVNGRELTAEDVKYSWDRINASRPTKVYIIDSIRSVDVVDKYTVKFTTTTPYAPFLTGLADADTEIVAKEVVDKFGDLKGPESVIGHGPFILKEYARGTSVTYAKNPDYFIKGRPYIDELRTLIIPDLSTQVASLLSGQLDVLRESIGPEIVAQLKKSRPSLVTTDYLTAGGKIYMRTDQPPFNDKRVRQAFSMAIDRKGWVDSLYMGKGEIAYGTMIPCMTGWTMSKSEFGPAAKYFEYNIQEAKRLLAEAGHPNGFKTEMNFTAYYGMRYVEWMELLKDFESRIGINMEIKLKEYGAHMATTYVGDFNGLGFTTISNYPDPDRIFQSFWPGGRMNQSHVDDAKLSEMLAKQQQTLDRTKRKAVIDDIQRYLAEEQYYIFVPAPINTLVYQPWVHNYGMRLDYARERPFEVAWVSKH